MCVYGNVSLCVQLSYVECGFACLECQARCNQRKVSRVVGTSYSVYCLFVCFSPPPAPHFAVVFLNFLCDGSPFTIQYFFFLVCPVSCVVKREKE